MKTNVAYLSGLSLALGLAITACNKINPIDDIKSNTKVFSPSKFKENIITALGNRPVGYNFVINHNGQWKDSAARGFARMSQDGAIPHSIYKEMNIASVTKWLTAVGAVKLLDYKGIKLTDSIYKWLPKSWKLGNKAKTITFHELLTHKAGLTTDDIRYGTDYNSLKTCIAAGVVNEAKGYNYSNVNFALFRIMFTYLNDKTGALNWESYNLSNKDTAAFSEYVSVRYLQLMQNLVFTPAEAGMVICTSEDRSKMTLMYNETTPAVAGRTVGDWKLVCGGGGYYMSAYQVAKVMAYVYHSEKVLTKAQQQVLLSNSYGLDGGHSPQTSRGKAYGKDGALMNDVNNNDKADKPDPGLQTLAIKFPGDVELVFFTNALTDGFTYYTSIMKNAYDDAWVKP
ncbi:serine hydrolase [Paraflavitalea pollutisoli]|uniref:serine hydrolase n=1 Tax=Paraflavitalea pollutisoli TaxID=3034143 RepID=UPI0023EDFBD8|nr:serine hydrolase [Paraflavitalea sp. H1-2-19X]